MRLEQVGRLVAHDLESIAALDQRDALCRQPFQLDRLHLGAVLLVLAGTLRFLVAIEVACDAAGRPVEEIDRRPQQVFEIGLEPGVFEHAGEGFEDAGKSGVDRRLVGQRPRVRLVLVRPVSVHLQLEDDAVGGRGGVKGLEAVVEGKVLVHRFLRRFGPRLSRPDGAPPAARRKGRHRKRSAAAQRSAGRPTGR